MCLYIHKYTQHTYILCKQTSILDVINRLTALVIIIAIITIVLAIIIIIVILVIVIQYLVCIFDSTAKSY